MSFEYVKKVVIPSRILYHTCKFLQSHGKEGKEAHSLWVGTSNNNIFHVSDVWFPRQAGSGIFFRVSEIELDRINRELYKKNLRLIAQIHSHQGAAFHSSINDEYPIVTTLGAFSIVIPNYGFVSDNNFHEYAVVFRLTETGWVELTQEEVDAIFSITDER